MRTNTLYFRSGALALAALLIGGCSTFSSDGGFGTVETAIDAMKQGAYDYILKPFKVEEIVHIVQRGLEKRRLAAENLRLREALSLYKVSEAIAASLSLDEVMATVTDSALNEVRADVVFTWLDNAEGGYFERNVECSHLVSHVKHFGEVSIDVVVERLATGEPVVAHETRAKEFFNKLPDAELYSVAVVPLKMRERLIGWIGVMSLTPAKRFDEGQRKLLSIVASRAAAVRADDELLGRQLLHAVLGDVARQVDEPGRERLATRRTLQREAAHQLLLRERDADPDRLQPAPELLARGVRILRADAKESARVAVGTVDRVDVAAAGLGPDADPAVIGGHSYGGRVASLVAADGTPGVRGLVLLSYPLHRPGGPEWEPRTAHWATIDVPVLMCSGGADPFARIDLLRRAVAERLPTAELVVYPRLGHTLKPVLDEVLDRVAAFVRAI